MTDLKSVRSTWKPLAERAYEDLTAKNKLPQEAIIDFIEARSKVRTPNRFEGRLGSQLGLESMLSEEQKLPYAGFSNKKLKSPDIKELKSPSRRLREEVKSSHHLKRIQGFFEQEKKA